MSIQVIPPGSSAVVTEDKERGQYGSKHPDRYDLVEQSEKVRAQSEVHATATALAASLSDQEMSSGFAAALVDSAKNAAALSVQSQKESDDLSVQAVNLANLASVQATTNFNALSVQANLNQYNILLDSQKNAAAGVLLATQNAASVAAQISECCCETKLMFAAQTATVLADGQKTRDLINSNEVSDLREKLFDAKYHGKRDTRHD